jgi:hypothetical protein
MIQGVSVHTVFKQPGLPRRLMTPTDNFMVNTVLGKNQVLTAAIMKIAVMGCCAL